MHILSRWIINLALCFKSFCGFQRRLFTKNHLWRGFGSGAPNCICRKAEGLGVELPTVYAVRHVDKTQIKKAGKILERKFLAFYMCNVY